MVNLQAFLQTIHNLTGEVTSKDLAQFCRKWLEENGDKISASEADRAVAMLIHGSNQAQFTLGIISVLAAKLTKMKSETDLLEYLTNLQTSLDNFDEKQLRWAPDIYDRLFENIGQLLLKKNNSPMWGIALLEKAILTYTRGNPNHLTNLHSTLFCLCLKARHFDRALPFLRVDVTELFKQSSENSAVGQCDSDKANGVSSSENSNQQQQSSGIASSAVSFLKNAVNTMSGSLGTKSEDPKPTQPLFKRRNVLLYFYYGAMIYAALEQWEEAVLFLEHAICLTTRKNSAIVLEAIKKYFIISLIIGRKKPLEYLPTYRTPVIQRNFLSLAIIYSKLPNLIQKSLENKHDLVSVLTDYLQGKRAVFTRDQNVGLMKVLINICRENSVKRLGNIFVSLQLGDVSRMAHLPSVDQGEGESVEQIILRLRQNGQLEAQIDGRTQTVIFEEKTGQSNASSKADVDAALTEVIELARAVRSFDDAIRLNPHFIEKTLQKTKERQIAGGNGGGGGGHSSGSVFPEDEGFYLTGSP